MQFQEVSFKEQFVSQQHGCVFWRKGAEKVLNSLDPTKFLFLQLANCFSVQDSPVWMDSSTYPFCQNMEERLGGPQVQQPKLIPIALQLISKVFRILQKLADLTGSRAYERFTAHQIAKIFSEKSDLYYNTEVKFQQR